MAHSNNIRYIKIEAQAFEVGQTITVREFGGYEVDLTIDSNDYAGVTASNRYGRRKNWKSGTVLTVVNEG